MDTYQYNEDQAPKRNSSAKLWNILTLMAVLGILSVACISIIIFRNPYTFINPFPPPTQPIALVIPSLTPTITPLLPPTWTATITSEPTLTDTPRPSVTLPLTNTPFSLVTPSITPTNTKPPGGYAFQVREGSPSAIKNIFHPELECSWMGVGGQAVDMSGGPVTGLIIRLGGFLPGVTIPENLISLTGLALSYGRAGYEFKLADRPIASKGQLWVQLLDQIYAPLSEKVYFDTFDSCDKNQIIIDFKQVR